MRLQTHPNSQQRKQIKDEEGSSLGGDLIFYALVGVEQYNQADIID